VGASALIVLPPLRSPCCDRHRFGTLTAFLSKSALLSRAAFFFGTRAGGVELYFFYLLGVVLVGGRFVARWVVCGLHRVFGGAVFGVRGLVLGEVFCALG